MNTYCHAVICLSSLEHISHGTVMPIHRVVVRVSVGIAHDSCSLWVHAVCVCVHRVCSAHVDVGVHALYMYVYLSVRTTFWASVYV